MARNLAARAAVALVTGVATLAAATPALAWCEHEHITLGAEALKTLALSNASPDDAAALATLRRSWAEIRAKGGPGTASLCVDLTSTYGTCLGLPSLPMLAADHACRVSELVTPEDPVMLTDVLAMAQAAAAELTKLETKPILDKDDRRAERLRIRRRLDFELQAVDTWYSSRAGNSRAHFVPPRADPKMDLAHYLTGALASTLEPNAVGLFALYHTRALQEARDARRLAGGDRVSKLWHSFVHESFALHFLGDLFASGHSAWIEHPAKRFGTHDFFSHHGVNATPWVGDPYLQHGDAFLLSADIEYSSRAIVRSLRQFAAALEPSLGGLSLEDAAIVDDAKLPDDFNLCTTATLPDGLASVAHARFLADAIELSPKPPLDEPGPPPFRNEYGPFVALGISLDGGPQFYVGRDDKRVADWNPEEVTRAAGTGEMRVSAGVGYAADDVISEYQDALMFFQAVGAISSDTRWLSSLGAGFQFRMPYMFFPGDALVWAPAAGLGAKWGYRATNSALKGDRALFGIPSVIYRSLGLTLNFDLAREAAFVWHWDFTPDTCNPRKEVCAAAADLSAHYTRWDVTLPVLSLRVAHTFGGTLGNDVTFRLAARLGNVIEGTPAYSVNRTLHDYRGFYGGIMLVGSSSARFYWGG